MIYTSEFTKHWHFPLHSPPCPRFTSVLLLCGNENSKLSRTGFVCSETLHSLPLVQWDLKTCLCAALIHSSSSRNWIFLQDGYKKKKVWKIKIREKRAGSDQGERVEPKRKARHIHISEVMAEGQQRQPRWNSSSEPQHFSMFMTKMPNFLWNNKLTSVSELSFVSVQAQSRRGGC